MRWQIVALSSSLAIAGCASHEPPPRSTPVVVATASGDAPLSTNTPKDPKPSGACATDADCVPAECCHPRSCVPAAQKPACETTMCTRECRGGSFDCGGGGCLCQSGACVAHFEQPPFRGK